MALTIATLIPAILLLVLGGGLASGHSLVTATLKSLISMAKNKTGAMKRSELAAFV